MRKNTDGNREAEIALLGAAIFAPDEVLPQLVERIEPRHLHLRPHRLIFETLLSMYREDELINNITVADRLERQGKLQDVGGRAYISKLLEDPPIPSQVGGIVEVILDYAQRWELHHRLAEAAERALEDPTDALDRVVTELKLAAVQEPGETAVATAPTPFPKDACLGLAADFATLYGRVVESPKSFLFASFLTCLGGLIGDRVALKSATRNPARLYTVLLGPSGSARKSTAIKLAVGFFERAVEGFPAVRGIGSAEGLAKVIKERGYTNCLLAFDELRSFVDKAKIDGSVLLPVVNSLFEDSYSENHTKGRTIELENVHLSLLSACTLDTFSEIFNRHFIGIGFPNRLFLVLDDAKDRKPIPKEVDREAELGLIAQMGAILARLRSHSPDNPLLLGLTPEAERIWGEFYETIPQTMSGIRLDQIGLRLAMLLAISQDKTEIDEATIKAAIRISKWELQVREEVLPIEADNAIAKMEEKIRRTLRARGPLKERELKRFTHANRSGLWIFETAKDNLRRAGEVAFRARDRVYVLLDGANGIVAKSVATSRNGGSRR